MRDIQFDVADERLVRSILNIPAFSPLGRERLPAIMQAIIIREYDRYEEILRQGEKGSSMFFLLSGRLSVVVDDVEVSIIDRVGTVFGEMGVIDTAPRSASIFVRQAAVCLVLDEAFFERLEGRAKLVIQAFFYKMFYEVMAQRLRNADERIADLDMQKTIMENMEI